MKKVMLQFDSIQKAREFVNVIGRMEGDYDLVQGHSYVDAKSFLGVFTLDIKRPVTLEMHDDKNYQELVLQLSDYVIKQAV